jgi:hypothetical protein
MEIGDILVFTSLKIITSDAPKQFYAEKRLCHLTKLITLGNQEIEKWTEDFWIRYHKRPYVPRNTLLACRRR